MPSNFRSIREQWRTEIRAEIKATKLRVKRKPSAWALRERKLPISSPVSTGDSTAPFTHDLFPHCVEPMDCADDERIRKIVLWFAIREGKTLSICLNILGRMVTDTGGNAYSIHPIESDVARFSEGDLEPMIEACLQGYFVEKKSRDSGRTIDFKKYRGGWVRIVNAGSVSKFSGTSVKVILLHELDRLNRDAIYKAFGRTTGYRDAIIVEESSGTLSATLNEDGSKKYRSNIEASYDEGDKRKWFCSCRECGALQWLKYEQIREVDTAEGIRHHYFCEQCEAPHTPEQWREMAAGGKWYPTAGLTTEEKKDISNNWTKAKPKRRNVASFWKNGAASLLPPAKGYNDKLHEFFEQERDSNTTPEARKIWVQEHRAELWSAALEGEAPPDWKPLFKRRENYNDGAGKIVIPNRCLLLFAGIDVQKYWLEIGWIGFGRRDETWCIDRTILSGHVDKDQVWNDLEEELERRFDHEGGASVQKTMAFIDCAKWPDRVYKWLKRKSPRTTIRACRGSNVRPHPVVNANFTFLASSKIIIATGEAKVNLRGHWIGGDEASDWIYGRLAEPPPPPGKEPPEGWHHFGMHCNEDYFEQLTSERALIEDDGSRRYEHVGPARNEVHDIHKYTLGAFRRQNWNWNLIEAQLLARAAEERAQPEAREHHAPSPVTPAPVARHSAIVSVPSAW